MKATFIIILLLAFFNGFSQVKKDSSSGALYPISIKPKDTAQLTDYSNLFSDKPKIIDSNYIRIYHAKINPSSPPLFYIDSVKTTSIGYINPKDITDIKIYGGIDSANKTNGKIYIKLKKHSYHLITIENLTRRCIPNFDNKTQAVIYLLNDKLISDTTDMKFEITYIRSVEVTDGSQIKAFKGILSSVIVLNIHTGDASDTSIYIRGNAAPVSFKQ